MNNKIEGNTEKAVEKEAHGGKGKKDSHTENATALFFLYFILLHSSCAGFLFSLCCIFNFAFFKKKKQQWNAVQG